MIEPEEFSYGMSAAGLDVAGLGEALQAVVADAMSDPERVSAMLAQSLATQQSAALTLLRRLGEANAPQPAPPLRDKRFANPAWTQNPFLLGMAESYLESARAAMALVESSQLPELTRRKARFAMHMLSDAVAPSNVPWMNPSVVAEAMNTGGMSLVRGMETFLHDVATHDGKPRQVDAKKFVLGGNLAATPGRIVFRNDLIELIAYEPQTAQVHAIPLLFSPPWINRYFILDLAPGRSWIEWAVLHGHQTFAISYRNPDASMAGFGIDDYISHGLLAALDAIERITGAKQTNIAALCLGGTLTLITLAYLAANGMGDRVASAALTNTLVDFSEPGELGIYTDERSVARLEAKMHEAGYLEAKELAGTFDWMRANDLIWSYVVNNWFMGKEPPAFDILAWNTDSTRMPAKAHSQYLRACYLHNALTKPGEFAIAGTPIDLGKITTPLYVLGAETDHIAPWKSTFRTTNLVGSTDLCYTLTNSGHIAGVVHPPGDAKSEHWTKERTVRAESADEWRGSATRVPGTWWESWAVWAEAHAGPLVAPAQLPPGDIAPGSYVHDVIAPPYDPKKTAKRKRVRKPKDK